MTEHRKPLKLGMIGAGFIGQIAHLDNYAQIKDCQMVALAAGRSQLRHQVAERYSIARTYATHRELLEDPEVKAVVVVTARPGIGPVSLDCIRAGKALLTEKPMASSIQQAETLIKEARERKVFYTVGYMRRYDSGIQAAKRVLDELIQTGELGPIGYVRAHCFAGDAYCGCAGHIVTEEKKTTTWDTWPIAPDWVSEQEKLKFHQYLNNYGHDINLLRYLLGKTPLVLSVQRSKADFQTTVFDFGEYIATLETGRYLAKQWDEVIEIYFAKGRMRITVPPALLKDVPANVELYKGSEQEKTQVIPVQPGWSFRRQAEAFVRDVLDGRESLSSAKDALEDIRIVETMWRQILKKTE